LDSQHYGVNMKKSTLAAVLLAGTAFATMPAKADLVLLGGSPSTAFIDVGGFGFGTVHRLLTLQDNGNESGSVIPINQPQGGAISGADKAATPTLGELGWTSRDKVGLFFDADQQGNTGITLQSLSVSIYNGANIVGTFATAAPITFSAADLALEPGNGQGGFFFALTVPQQVQFDAILAMAGSSNFRVSTAALLGCPTISAGCLVSNDGPDSFNGVAFVPGPVVGASIPGLVAALGGMFGLNFWRRRRNGATLPA
jgi:hypothetical protein